MGIGNRLVAALAGLAGCSTQNVGVGHVKTDAIYQTYQVTYDAGADTSHAYARFRVGGGTGTNVDLAGRAAVTCNKQPLREGLFGVLGRYYEQTTQGFAGDYEFVFTDAEGKTFVNAVRAERIGFDAQTPATLSRGRAHTLTFDGPPVRAGDTVALHIEQVAGPGAGKNAAAQDPFGGPAAPGLVQVLAKAAGATTVELRREDLAALRDGPARVRWARTTDPGLQAPTPAGGGIAASYLSAYRAVTLEK